MVTASNVHLRGKAGPPTALPLLSGPTIRSEHSAIGHPYEG
ncbi:hypothetical protein [Streptomyces sp. NPDC048650]